MWDIFGRARLLRLVAEARQSGLSEKEALKKVKRLHYSKFKLDKSKTLNNQLSAAKQDLALLSLLKDTDCINLVPKGELEGRLWRRLSSSSPSVGGKISPNPDDSEGVIVDLE
jgi:hypothetical protein